MSYTTIKSSPTEYCCFWRLSNYKWTVRCCSLESSKEKSAVCLLLFPLFWQILHLHEWDDYFSIHRINSRFPFPSLTPKTGEFQRREINKQRGLKRTAPTGNKLLGTVKPLKVTFARIRVQYFCCKIRVLTFRTESGDFLEGKRNSSDRCWLIGR